MMCVARNDVEDARCIESHIMGDNVDVRTHSQRDQRLPGRLDLAITDAIDIVQTLVLHVRWIDNIHVDDAECADAGSRKVQRRW